MIEARELKRHFQGKKRAFVKILSPLVAARTENPPGNESAAADVFERFCSSINVRTKRIEKLPGRTNIVATVGKDSPRLLVVCHLDTVPAGEGWRTDPFKAVEKKSRIYGRGVSDNKGQLAACLLTLTYLKKMEKELSGLFILAGAADEECGSENGMVYLMKKGALAADYAIIPDSADNMKTIDITEKGALFLRITSHGKQAHGSTPHRGVSAIWNMVELLNLLRKFKFPGDVHPLHSPPTLNIGTIQGGSAVNMVPGRCTAEVDIRYLPGQRQREYIEKIRDLIYRIERQNPSADFKLKVLASHKPSEVPADEPVVKIIQESARDIAGFMPIPVGLSGATVTKQLIEHGIKAVGFAPGDSAQPHTANESISINEFVDFSAILALIAVKIIGK